MNNEYWLYIEPYVYLEIKSESALLYNTLDHEFIIYDDPTIISLLKDLLSESSNGVILLDENLSNMKVVEKLIFDYLREIQTKIKEINKIIRKNNSKYIEYNSKPIIFYLKKILFSLLLIIIIISILYFLRSFYIQLFT